MKQLLFRSVLLAAILAQSSTYSYCDSMTEAAESLRVSSSNFDQAEIKAAVNLAKLAEKQNGKSYQKQLSLIEKAGYSIKTMDDKLPGVLAQKGKDLIIALRTPTELKALKSVYLNSGAKKVTIVGDQVQQVALELAKLSKSKGLDVEIKVVTLSAKQDKSLTQKLNSAIGAANIIHMGRPAEKAEDRITNIDQISRMSRVRQSLGSLTESMKSASEQVKPAFVSGFQTFRRAIIGDYGF